MPKINNYLKPAILSIAIHALIVIALFVHLSNTKAPQLVLPKATVSKPIVHAKAITNSEIQAEMARLQKVQQQKQLRAKREVAALDQKKKQADLARKKLAKEQQLAKRKLNDLQKKLNKSKLEQQKQTELFNKRQKELAALKKSKDKLTQDTDKLQQKRKQLAAEKLAQEKKLANIKRLQQEAQIAEQLAHEEKTSALISEVQRFSTLINDKISENWHKPVGTPKGLFCVFAVDVLPDGEITAVNMDKSSGNLAFDRSAEVAIKKSSPLPLPPDQQARAQFRHFTFTFKPEQA